MYRNRTGQLEKHVALHREHASVRLDGRHGPVMRLRRLRTRSAPQNPEDREACLQRDGAAAQAGDKTATKEARARVREAIALGRGVVEPEFKGAARQRIRVKGSPPGTVVGGEDHLAKWSSPMSAFMPPICAIEGREHIDARKSELAHRPAPFQTEPATRLEENCAALALRPDDVSC
jgi:hypothetical protein